MEKDLPHKPICIVILGTGNSGTSCISKILHEQIDIPMGIKFVPSVTNDPKKFYEDDDIVKLNSKRDSKSKMDGNNPSLTLEQWRIEMKKHIEKRSQNNNVFGIKDPRIAEIWDDFKQIFEELSIEYKLIITKRDKESTVKSMMKYLSNQMASKIFDIRDEEINKITSNLKPSEYLVLDLTERRNEVELKEEIEKWIKNF